LNKARIDVQISGHTHRYATHDADATHAFPIVIGGGPLEGKRTIIKFHATQKELNLKMIRDDGELVGKYTIPKKAK
jgi:UDP-2,3-diacylglucosamine pyrophosphatase LpxH